MIDWIRSQLFKETYKRGIDPKDLFFVKRTGGDFTSEGRAIFEIVRPGSEDPIWVVKANRSPIGNDRLAAEFDRLVTLRKGLPEDIRFSLPKAIVFEERATGSASIETFLPGTRISSYFLHGSAETIWRNWQSYGQAAIRWLERYSEVERPQEIRFDREWYRREIVEPIGILRDRWTRHCPEGSEIADQLIATEIDFDLSLSVTHQHGDYTPGNLIAMEERLGVIDWSPVDFSNPPLMDLFHFLLSSSIYMGRGLNRKPSEILSESKFVEKIQLEIQESFLQTGVPVEARVPLLRAACWKKIEGCLSKPQVVESSLIEWTRLLGGGNLEEFERRVGGL